MPLLLALIALPAFDLASFERPRLVAEAESLLTSTPHTIVEVSNPRSAGGLHDFSSEGDYWWPDPKNPKGPYILRDGMTNPDNFVAHRQRLLAFARDFDALAAAYKVTGDERFARAAVRHLDAWFVAPQTRMNPSLQYAQAVTGVSSGRSTGVIDTVHFAEVALGIEGLRRSPSFSPSEQEAVIGWFRDYLHWLQTSPNGIGESRTTNNHVTCWALQAAAFAHLVGDKATLAACRHRLLDEFIPDQMAQDGSFPKELARTKPYGYSIFNLDVMSALAVVLSTPDDNLMTRALPDGRSLVKAVGFLAPYLADKSRWPKKPDVMYWDGWPVRQPSLIFGALATGRTDWLETWKRLDPDPKVEELRRNYPIRQPVLWIN